MHKSMMRIIQKKLFSSTQDVLLTDDDFIAITVKRMLSERTFKFDLRDLNQEPSRQKAYPQKPIALCILFGLLFLTGALPALNERDPAQRGTYVFSALFWGMLIIVSALYAWFTRSDFHAYFNRYSGKPVFTLYHGKPSPESFDAFITALNARLKVLNPRMITHEELRPFERRYPHSLT